MDLLEVYKLKYDINNSDDFTDQLDYCEKLLEHEGEVHSDDFKEFVIEPVVTFITETLDILDDMSQDTTEENVIHYHNPVKKEVEMVEKLYSS